MRVAIDARKLHDFGIGTYIRNLLRHLARIDQLNEYVLLCQEPDLGVAAQLGPNFRTVLEPSPNYSLREQIHVPWVLRRERPDVFHAPHYVLPPAVRCRSVVTIHDCIHLMFPQYLPNRAAYAYAKASMWNAAKRSDRMLTVSEASKRDILHFFNVPPEKIVVVYNAIDERFWVAPKEEDMARVRERYQLDHGFVLYVGNIKPHKNLVRLIEAFDRAAPGWRLRRAEAADHRRRDLEAARAAACGPQPQAAQARALPRLPAGRDAGDPVPAGGGVRVPVALRRVRPAAARGDGERHAGGDVERLVAARGRRRRRRCWSIRTTRTRSSDGIRRVLTDPALAQELRMKGLVRAREFSWERSVARTCELYKEVGERN